MTWEAASAGVTVAVTGAVSPGAVIVTDDGLKVTLMKRMSATVTWLDADQVWAQPSVYVTVTTGEIRQ